MARRKLNSTEPSLKMLIEGQEGTRKSNTAINIARMLNKSNKPLRVLLIDLEYKAIEGFNERLMIELGVDPRNILEMRTRDLDDIYVLIEEFSAGRPIPVQEQIITKEKHKITGIPIDVVKEKFNFKEYELDAEDKPFIADVLIIDSLSVYQNLLRAGREDIVRKRTNLQILNNGLTGDAREQALDNMGMQFRDWAVLQSKAMKLVQSLQTATGKHIIYISRTKGKTKKIINNGTIETIDVKEEMDATSFKFLPYEVNVHLKIEKTDNGDILFNIAKDSFGVYESGSTIKDFSILKYEEFLNDETKTNIVRTQSYAQNIQKASIITEETIDGERSKDGDIKMKLYNEIVLAGKQNQKISTLIKNYCSKNNLKAFNNPERISLNSLTEINELIKNI